MFQILPAVEPGQDGQHQEEDAESEVRDRWTAGGHCQDGGCHQVGDQAK